MLTGTSTQISAEKHLMRNPAHAHKHQFPLHVHISAMFTFLLLMLGTVLGVFNYQQTTRIILGSSQDLFRHIEQVVQLDLLNAYQPIRNVLNLLALNPNVTTDHVEFRTRLLQPFGQILADNPTLAALYIGDDNGNFFLVRALRDQATRRQVQAPPQASYQAWTIIRSAQQATVESKIQFLDASMALLEQRSIPNETYDPRARSWFIPALADNNQTTTRPYLFFTTHEVGTTLAKRSAANTVLGADVTLSELSGILAKHQATPGTQLVLFGDDGRAVAYPDISKLLTAKDPTQLPKVSELSPALSYLMSHGADAQQRLNDGQRQWIVSTLKVNDGSSNGLKLAMMIPEDELLADAYKLRWQGALVTLAILLLCLPLGWLASRMLVRPLQALVREADAIRRFDFSYPLKQQSPVLEIDLLEASMGRMKETLASFFEITSSLSAHTRFEPLLHSVLFETLKIAQAQASLIYLTKNDSTQLELNGLIINGQPHDLTILPQTALDPDDSQSPEWLRALCQGNDSITRAFNFEQAGYLQPVMQALDSHSIHVIGIRLHNRHSETVGILVLVLNDSGSSVDQDNVQADRVAFIQAVAGTAAVAIESQRLQANQKQLLDALIQLLAGAIDAKSPYTASHCQRVPTLTLMLARAAAANQQPPFEQYNPTDEQWEALRIAAWLHDCGKVTTPEYVVDKATKLETLYDRIHEIRTRFEVLKRDTWINYWQAHALGGNEQQLAELRDTSLAALDDDFSFVARCNLGGEAMLEADLERLDVISLRTWSRTLDDRLGVSWEENKRQSTREEQDLPVTEQLLADKPEHLFHRPEADVIAPENPWGFKLDVPQYKFNRGELHNLSIKRGTLTGEERYIINNHIVQTILMLSSLPLPGYLSNITEIAGGHHEKMDGSGYPKRLKREEMSLESRMMAIADIFEALTASDRPYKRSKTLSEALSIMATMCRDAHIDPQLFALFMHEQVYMQYAQQFLDPQQIDSIDIDALMLKAGLTGF